MKECTLITAKECPKRVLHLSLDVTGSGMEFLPGDAAGVCPANDPSIVDGLLEHLQLDGSLCAPNNPPSMPSCCTQVVLAPLQLPCNSSAAVCVASNSMNSCYDTAVATSCITLVLRENFVMYRLGRSTYALSVLHIQSADAVGLWCPMHLSGCEDYASLLL